MKELKRFQGSTFDTIARSKLVEDQDTILELTGKIQELQKEINCMNDSRDFEDAESVRSGHSHVTSQPGVFPKHPPFEGLLRPSFISQLTGKIQDLQNEINCMKDSKDLQDAESISSGSSHATSRPVLFPPHQDLGGMLSRSLGMPSRREGPPSIWDTHGISGNVFLQIQSRLLQHLIRKSPIHGSLMYQNTHHHM